MSKFYQSLTEAIAAIEIPKVDAINPNDIVEDNLSDYLTAISPKFSVLFIKKINTFHVFCIETKELIVKKDYIPIQSLTFISPEKLVAFANKKFHIFNLQELMETKEIIPFTINIPFEKVTKIGVDDSIENSIFYFAPDSFAVYRQYLDFPNDPPELIVSNVDLFSPAKNGIFISQMDGIKLIAIDNTHQIERFSLPIVDATMIAGGDTRFAVEVNHKIEIYNELGSLVQTFDACTKIDDQCESVLFITKNTIIFVEPYLGECRIKAVAAGKLQNVIYFWKMDGTCASYTAPNPKTNIVLLNDQYKETTEQNTEENEANNDENKRKQVQRKREEAAKQLQQRKGKQEKQSNQNKPKKEGKQPKKEEKEEKEEEKEEKESIDEQILHVEERSVPFILYTGSRAFSIKNFNEMLLKGDKPIMFLPIGFWKLSFGLISSTYEESYLKTHFEKYLGSECTVDIFENEPSVDPIYILAGPGQPIKSADMKAIGNLLKNKIEIDGPVHIFNPDPNSPLDIYYAQYFKHVLIGNQKLNIYDKIEDVPICIVTGIDIKNQKAPQIIADLFQFIKTPKASFPIKNCIYVLFASNQEAQQALEKDYSNVDGKTIEVVKFSYPLMRMNKNLNIQVTGVNPRDSEKDLFNLMKGQFKNLMHVWKQNPKDDSAFLFFINEKDINSARQKLKKPLKVGGNVIKLI